MISKMTEQMNQWMGDFGKNYTDRNFMTLEGMETVYLRNYGVTKSELNRQFFKGIQHTARILEVGSNIGNQLLCLAKIGFSNLYGIEL
jgi:hypothetical protein